MFYPCFVVNILFGFGYSKLQVQPLLKPNLVDGDEASPSLERLAFGGKMKLINVSTKRYPNTFAKIDDEDFELVSKSRWYAYSGRNTTLYCGIAKYVGNYKTIHLSLARFLMNPKKEQIVDHINGDGLDNKRANLRICTVSENCRNQKKQRRNTSSIYKGVGAFPGGKFRAYISHNGKYQHIGLFKTEEEAAIAYNFYAKKYFGEYANVNKI